MDEQKTRDELARVLYQKRDTKLEILDMISE
jgi:hypothetical protein